MREEDLPVLLVFLGSLPASRGRWWRNVWNCRRTRIQSVIKVGTSSAFSFMDFRSGSDL